MGSCKRCSFWSLYQRRAQPCGWFDRTPVEANEFTIRMISLDVAHLKVRAYCTKPLPPLVELLRDDGSIIPISVTYPWVPPSCTCCKQLCHLEARCPHAKWAHAKWALASLLALPWIFGGDFNEIIHHAENSSPAFDGIYPPVIEFRQCLDDL